jgi:hypothetical protein
MAIQNVWADDPVDCRAELKGDKYKDTKKVEFVFTEGGNELGRIEAALDKKSGIATGKWEKAKGPNSPEAVRTLAYHLEIDGKKLANFPDEIQVWAKELTIVAQKPDGSALSDAVCHIRQHAPKPPVPGRPGDQDVERKTGPDGKVVWRLVHPASVSVEWSPPYFLLDKKWIKDKGIAWEAKVEKIVPVKLASPRPPDKEGKLPCKQFVNLPADAKDERLGPKVKVKVVPAGADKLDKGRKIFLKAEYDGGNSDRKNSAGEVTKGKAKTDSKGADDKGGAEFEVEVGHAGGDKIIVSVGSTDECKDDKVVIETWRKLQYELIAPECMKARMSEREVAGTKGWDFPDKAYLWFTDRLGKGFVEFERKASQIFGDDKVTNFLVDGSYIGKAGADAAAKFYVLGWPIGFDTAKDPVAFGAADSRTLLVRLCDVSVLSDRSKPSLDFTVRVTAKVTKAAGPRLFAIDPGVGDNPILGGATWTAEPDATAFPHHPGIGKHGTLSAGALKPTKLGELTVDLTGVADAETLAGPPDATHCKIKVDLEYYDLAWINGAAGGGRQMINLNRPLKAAACTICHELGHNMGLTVFATGTYKCEPPYGITTPDPVPAGDMYDAHKHIGTHCAYQVADKTGDDFRGRNGKCIMFGEGGDDEEPTRANFCPTCTTMIRGRNLTDVKSSYKGRAKPEDY